MLYLYRSECISPQPSVSNEATWENLVSTKNNKVEITEPEYKSIPDNILRRMGKALRMGVGGALSLDIHHQPVDGIIIGTANGGMEDSIKFLNQIIDYNEGMLTPTSFVQSTPNSIAAQISLLSSNQGYNTTHVHRGLAFENALLDVMMLINENPDAQYLVGGIDEISEYNFRIDTKGGWYKSEPTQAAELYRSKSNGSLVGEGATFFVAGGAKSSENVGSIVDIALIHGNDPTEIGNRLAVFLKDNKLNFSDVDSLMLGENGDIRFDYHFTACEQYFPTASTFRFKHLSGEYPTASAYALWLSMLILQHGQWPSHTVKEIKHSRPNELMLIYNHYKGEQHGFILLRK